MQTFRNHLKVPVISSISCTRPLKKLSCKCQMFSRDWISSYFWASQTLQSTFTTWNVPESHVEISPRHSKSFVGSVVSGSNCSFGVWRQSIWRIYCASILDESAEHDLAADGSRSVPLFTGSLNHLFYAWLGLLVAAVGCEKFPFVRKSMLIRRHMSVNHLNVILMSGIRNISRFNEHYLCYFAFLLYYIVYDQSITNQLGWSYTIEGLIKSKKDRRHKKYTKLAS